MEEIQNKKVIAIVGEMASGKDAVKKYLFERYGAQSIKYSQIPRDILNRLYLPESRENLSDVTILLINRFGQDLLANVIIRDASKLDASIVVLDGARRYGDIGQIMKIPNFTLMAVVATPENRYERLVKRAENPGDDEKTFSEFMNDHKRETEKSIQELIEMAHYKIDNNGTFEDLYKQVDDVMIKILATK